MTPSEFKAIFPEFAAVEDADIQVQLDKSDEYFNVCLWGGWLSEGISNLVAHWLTLAAYRKKLADAGGNGMASTGLSKKVGDLQITNSEALLLAKQNNPFMATTYGQEYYRLMKLVGSGMKAV